MFNINTLKNITLDDREKLEPLLVGLNEFGCEMSFANLVMWHQAYGTQYAFDECSRLILYSKEEKMIYFPRGGSISVSELAELSRIFYEAGLTNDIIYDVPESFINENCNTDDFFIIDNNQDNFDYLYDNEHLAACSGSKLRKKRNLIKQFTDANMQYRIYELNTDTAERFRTLSMRLNSRLDPCDFITDENKVIDFACQKYDSIGLYGILLNDGQNDVGFSIWSYLNANTADIHFEKADHNCKGAAQFLTCRCAAILAQQQIKYMNREQDLGSAGIRQAKKSLDPEFLYRRYTLTRKKN